MSNWNRVLVLLLTLLLFLIFAEFMFGFTSALTEGVANFFAKF